MAAKMLLNWASFLAEWVYVCMALFVCGLLSQQRYPMRENNHTKTKKHLNPLRRTQLLEKA